MARFNVKSPGIKVVNRAGGKAYSLDDKSKLITLVLTSFVKDQFYRGANEQLQELSRLCDKLDPKFVAKAGIYARNVFGMRSITHALAGNLLMKVKGEEWLKFFIQKVVHRVDDLTEIASYYSLLNGSLNPLPNAFKKGFNLAIQNFNRYQIAKYKGKGKEISLVDLVRLCHPKPSEKNTQILNDLIYDKLKSKDTWENNLTQVGQTVKDPKEKIKVKSQEWLKLLQGNKLGYLALIRNIRNILDTGNEESKRLLIEQLTNKKAIERSLVFPFQIQTAYDHVDDRDVIMALNQAMEISLNNVPKFDGNTLVVLDESGSMMGKPLEIGSLFAAVVAKRNNADLMLFSNKARYKKYNPLDSLCTIVDNLKRDLSYEGTNFHVIFETAKKAYDRIIILSDMQGWIGFDTPVNDFNEYKRRFKCNPFIYSFDLEGYGDCQFPEDNIFLLTGFHPTIFKIMEKLEQDKKALIKEIEKVEI